MRTALEFVACVTGTGLALAGALEAQTLYGFDGNPGGAAPVVLEFTGPPAGPGGYPNGPRVSSFPATGGTLCPGLAPTPPVPPIDGDIAVNTVTDEIWASDVNVIARYASNGAFVDSFPSPLPVAGMGFDAAGPLIWITDGVIYGALPVPAAYACAAPPPAFAIGPFPVPMGPGFFQAPITDIAWDPGTGTLWGCDLAGIVGNFVPGGPFVPGPFGFFPVAPGPCGLVPTLTGIAVDNTLPGAGIVYVSDPAQVAHLAPGGAPAPATFYSPLPCSPVPAPPLGGLAFAARPISFGQGADNGGAMAPRPGSIGQSIVPNPGLSFTLSGSVPGASAALLLSPAPLAPPLSISGVPLYLNPPLTTLGLATVDGAGRAFVNTPLLTVGTGATLFVQWVAVTPLPSLQTSAAMAFTTAVP